MAGGGAAPPVKLNDVAVLLGGVLLLTAFVLLFWDPALELDATEHPWADEELPPGSFPIITKNQTYDLSSGDKVVVDLSLIDCPDEDDAGDCGTVSIAWAQQGESLAAEDWTHHQMKEGGSLKEEFDVSDSGEWTLYLKTDSEISVDMDVEHQWLVPWLAMFLGFVIAAWGIWHSQVSSEK